MRRRASAQETVVAVPAVDLVETSPNLCGPRRFGVGVHFKVKAVDQFACERRALFVGKTQGFSE